MKSPTIKDQAKDKFDSNVISLLTLRFKDPLFEKEFCDKGLNFHNVRTSMLKILAGYACCILALLCGVTIYKFSLGHYDSGSHLVILLSAFLITSLCEGLLLRFSPHSRFCGFLGSILPLATYHFLLKEVNSDLDYPPGDFGCIPITMLIGIAICRTWLSAAISSFTAILTFFMLNSMIAPYRHCKYCAKI
jgi:hypothetical protein